MIHAHVTSWFVGIILFFVAWYLRGNEGKFKKIQMALRLFYLFIIGTGFYLLSAFYHFYDTAVFKGVLGLWVIFSMEMVLIRASKGKSTTAFWIQFLISLILVMFYGYLVLK